MIATPDDLDIRRIATTWAEGTEFTADDLIRECHAPLLACKAQGETPKTPTEFFQIDLEIPEL